MGSGGHPGVGMGVQGGWGRGWDPRAPRGAFRGALGRELGVPGAWCSRWGCLVPCRGLQPHAAMGPGPWPPFPSCLRRERGLCAAAAPCRCGTSGSPGMKGLFRRGLRPRPASGNRSRGGRLQPGTQCPSVLGTWVPHPACPAGTSRPWAVSRAEGELPRPGDPDWGSRRPSSHRFLELDACPLLTPTSLAQLRLLEPMI